MKSIYKTIFLITILILLGDSCFAKETSTEPEFIEVVTDSLITTSKIALGAIAVIVGIIGGIVGIALSMAVLIPLSIFYAGGEAIVNSSDEKMTEVKLCPAALALQLDFSNSNNAYYYQEAYYKDYNNVTKIEPFFKPLNKINKKPNYLCINCNKKSTKAEGLWSPIRAFTYAGDSYIQFAHKLDNEKYVTATTSLVESIVHLKYNSTYVFLKDNLAHQINVKDLCTRLRQLSIHKLQNKDA